MFTTDLGGCIVRKRSQRPALEDKRPSESSVEHFSMEAEEQHVTTTNARSLDTGAQPTEHSEPPMDQCEEQAEMYD